MFISCRLAGYCKTNNYTLDSIKKYKKIKRKNLEAEEKMKKDSEINKESHKNQRKHLGQNISLTPTVNEVRNNSVPVDNSKHYTSSSANNHPRLQTSELDRLQKELQVESSHEEEVTNIQEVGGNQDLIRTSNCNQQEINYADSLKYDNDVDNYLEQVLKSTPMQNSDHSQIDIDIGEEYNMDFTNPSDILHEPDNQSEGNFNSDMRCVIGQGYNYQWDNVISQADNAPNTYYLKQPQPYFNEQQIENSSQGNNNTQMFFNGHQYNQEDICNTKVNNTNQEQHIGPSPNKSAVEEVNGQDELLKSVSSNFVQEDNMNSTELSPLPLTTNLPLVSDNPEMGHGTIFPKTAENNMKMYLNDCSMLYIPKTQTQFHTEILFYYKWSTCRNIEKRRKTLPKFSKHKIYEMFFTIIYVYYFCLGGK